MYVVKNKKAFYIFSGVLILSCVVVIALWGIPFGIEFRGGTLLEIDYPDGRPDLSELREALVGLKLSDPSIRTTGSTGYIIRMRSLSDEDRLSVLRAVGFAGSRATVEKRFDSIQPILGREAARKSLISIALVILGILSYITLVFWKVSKPVSSWKYGVITILALLHDVLVPTGVFSAVARFFGGEVDTLFVTALLVILGFSVHDTIVVFDRVRENLKFRGKESFEEVVGRSVSQTITRSINTSLTTLFAVVVLYFIGPEAVRNFSLVLFIGITAGTYSSICLASPLLVTVEKRQKKK